MSEVENIVNQVARSHNYHLKVSMVTHATLPEWLDNYIYNELNASYNRSSCNMTVIDWGRKELLGYLGTYFPRSFTESYCIFSHYIQTHKKKDWTSKETISVFDFGCGSGGELFGLIQAIIDQLPNVKTLNISVLDGNQHALRLLEKILIKYQGRIKYTIKLKIYPDTIEDIYDLSIIDEIISESFDIIITFKSICEFVSKERFKEKNAYIPIISQFITKIEIGGILLLGDISSFNDTINQWIPNLIDHAINKLECAVIAMNQGNNQIFHTTHSQKNMDLSKLTWRIISKNEHNEKRLDDKGI